MANPQLENGYVRIANEIYDVLCWFRLSGECTLVLNYIIRKTYGYGKKEDAIALSQFASATKLSKAHVCRALKTLKEHRVIIANMGTGNTTKYKINKDFDTWKPLPRKGLVVPNLAIGSPHIGNKPVPILGHTKDNTKDNIQKTITGEAKTPHPAKQFLTDYGDLFKERFGTTYLASFKKDTVLIKDMLSGIEYDDLLSRARQFMKDDDDFIKKAGYTIGTFRSKVNKYVTKKSTQLKGYQPERLTPEQAQAAEAAQQEAMRQLREKGILRNDER